MAEKSGQPELFIHELQVTNYKKLRHVAIRLQPGMNRLVGENEAGKTTLLDAIRDAIGGAKVVTGNVITRGEERCELVLKFGGFTVERRFRKNEKGGEDQTVVLLGPDGGPTQKPQTTLDAFYDKYSFDPLAFMRMKPAEQVDVLKRLGNLNFGPLEAARLKLYNERTDVNAKGAAAKARYLAMPTPPADLPPEPVNVDELLAEQNRLQQVRLDNQAQRNKLEQLGREVGRAGELVSVRLKAVEAAKAALAAAEQAAKEADSVLEHVSDVAREQRAVVEKLTDPEIGDLVAKISAAQTTNLWHDRKKSREALRAELDDLKKLSDELTAKIDALDKQKTDAIASAKLPVEKLGFTDETPTYDGFPLSDGSAAVQLRVSVAIGVALNPKLPFMLVRDAALMGTAQLELLKQICVERRAQLLVEIAARDAKDLEVMIQEGDVVVVDGKVEVKGGKQLELAGEGGAA